MSEFERNYKRLNPEQKLAVDTIYGPVMVVAGPGTGKTQILSLRIANILKQTDALPQNILCLTFTEAGVKAMKKRLRSFIGNDSYKVSIHTFHSFTNEIIQAFPEYFQFAKELKQIDRLTQIKLVQDIIDRIEKDNPKHPLIPFYDKYAKVNDILNAIQSLKKEYITPEKLVEKNERLKEIHEASIEYNSRGKNKGKPKATWLKFMDKLETVDSFVEIYKQYQETVREEGFYDFDDMILFVIKAFEEHDDLLAYFQEKYQFIHVDEFQDTNGSQNEIISFLGSWEESPNIFIVGDDDQAIYRFQGANLDNILTFNEQYSRVQTIPTLTNYRSTQAIINVAQSLIQNNEERLTNKISNLEKSLTSFKSQKENEHGAHAEIWHFSNADEENIFIAQKIRELIDKGVKPEEIAILYRKHAHAEDIATVLNTFEIDTDIATTQNAFEHEIVQQLLQILRLVLYFNKDQNELLYRVMHLDFLEIDSIQVYNLAKKSRKERREFFDVALELLESSEGEEALDKESEAFADIKRFISKVKDWHKLEKNTALSNLVREILDESGLLTSVATNKESDFEGVLALNAFFKYIQSQETINPQLTLEAFINDLEIVEENRISLSLPSAERKQAVNLMTAHSSKGLEYEYVFMIKATSNNWGKTRANYSIIPEELFKKEVKKDDEKALQLEDERRLFFVALTRAKEKVFITYANEYLDYNGNVSKSTESQFLNELDEAHLLYKTTVRSEDQQPDLEIETEDYIQTFRPLAIANHTEREKEYLREQLQNFTMSPSALNSYLRSPEEFKFQYLLNLPRTRSKHAALGTGIHVALEVFNRARLSSTTVSLDDMKEVFETTLKKEFEADDEYERTLEEGIGLLENYYEKVLTEDSTPIIGAEYNFSYHPIYLEISENEALKLGGRLDAIYSVDKESKLAGVIDYKTGSPKTEGEIRGTTKTSDGAIWRQLVFYKLLADLDREFMFDAGNGKLERFNVDTVEVRFIKEKSKKFRSESFKVGSTDVLELKDLIKTVWEKIKNFEFPEETDIILR